MIHKEIEHHPEKSCFTLSADGAEALLQYHLLGQSPDSPDGVNFTRTFVPPALRGQGLAESLVRHGLAWARAQGYSIEASCWYVAKFLR